MRLDLTGKRVLITGGSGSFGIPLARAVLEGGAEAVRLFSNDEGGLFEARAALGGDRRIRLLIGDVRDRVRVRQACEGIDIVYHAAALKHVELCEYNPFEALKTNILGTQYVVEAAIASGVGRVIFTSSDKAANPANTMGTSKLFAEKLVTAASFWRGRHPTVFASVRFGNVLGSRGSVVPVFRRQIAAGGPVTVTDGSMTRFVMSADDAVRLVLDCTAMACGGEIFVLKMQAVRIQDLAEVMIERLARGEVRIEETGPFPGEKPHEELMTPEEVRQASETSDLFILRPAFRFTDVVYAYPGVALADPDRERYASCDEPLLSKGGIGDLLARAGLLD